MSLAIAFKGPEGIVLAADSRVTLEGRVPGKNISIPATYDTATKLLQVSGQDYVGAVTYGLGALGQREPRTAHSFIPEFESKLNAAERKRMSVKGFATEFGQFFADKWADNMPSDYKGPPMLFLVGGYDEDQPYGKVFELSIPNQPKPKEWQSESFGIVWGGQQQFAERLIHGFDQALVPIIKESLKLSEKQLEKVKGDLRQVSLPIPYQFLPLQDCVDLSIFLIRMTITIQNWIVAVRGVGGFIDVATITKTAGFEPVQTKHITGERSYQ